MRWVKRQAVAVVGNTAGLMFMLWSWWTDDLLCDTLALHRRMWLETYPGRREYFCMCRRCGLLLHRTRGGWWK